MPQRSALPTILATGIAVGLLAGAGGYLALAYLRPTDPSLLRQIDLRSVTRFLNDAGAADADYDVQLVGCDTATATLCRRIVLSSRVPAVKAAADPIGAANGWNAAHNVGRVYVDAAGMIFTEEIDISGGVSPTNLQARLRSWFTDLTELRRTFGG